VADKRLRVGRRELRLIIEESELSQPPPFHCNVLQDYFDFTYVLTELNGAVVPRWRYAFYWVPFCYLNGSTPCIPYKAVAYSGSGSFVRECRLLSAWFQYLLIRCLFWSERH